MAHKILKSAFAASLLALTACGEVPTVNTAAGDPVMLADGKTLIQHSAGAANQNNCLEGVGLKLDTWKITPHSPGDMMEHVDGGTVAVRGGCELLMNAAGMIIAARPINVDTDNTSNSTLYSSNELKNSVEIN